MKHTQRYLEYLESDAWAQKRQQKLDAAGNKCFLAGDIRYRQLSDGTYEEVDMCSGALQVHHLSYKNLGHEPLIDLRVLCEWHHEQEHKLWNLKARRRE